jgi:predicted ATPase
MLRLPKSDPAAAEAQFQQAAAIARQQGAKLWELRAATCLVRLWGERARHGEAHDLLATLVSQFTDGLGHRIYRLPTQYFERPLSVLDRRARPLIPGSDSVTGTTGLPTTPPGREERRL